MVLNYYNASISLYGKNMHYTKLEVDRAQPAYLMRRGPVLVRMVFLNEKSYIFLFCTDGSRTFFSSLIEIRVG